ncbi:MAG TPA: GAF domain-containing sensor histidine kinase [Nocardioides sp.]|nr:GAF domain-containing sensor histidine kinase [Nocardioides sp.]
MSDLTPLQVHRRTPAARVAVGVLVVLGVAILGLSLWLDVAAETVGPGAELAQGWGSTYTLLGAVLTGLAAVILVSRPGQGFGWGMAWLGLFWSLDGLSQTYVRYAITSDHALAGSNLALWFFNRVGSYLPLSLALLLMLFPDGRYLPGRWRVLSWVATIGMAVAATGVVVSPARDTPEMALPPGVDLDAGSIPIPDPVTSVAAPVCLLISVVGLLVAMMTVVVRYRRSQGLERDRMRWLAWSVVAMALVITISAGLEVSHVNDAALFVVMVLPAVAMTVGIVRPELLAIDDLLVRTVVWTALAATILAADVAVIAVLDALLGDALHQRQVVLTVLLLSVVLYGPLRLRLARLVQRLLVGRRQERYDAVAGLASTLETTDEGPEQLAAVAQAVATAFGVRYVGVEVDRGAGEKLLATYGERPPAVRVLPITYREAEVGRLVLPARGMRSRLTARDERLLGDLVRQAATAARTSRLAEEVQESRERLVTAREEERRRIRRDLHDGLGPALSGVVFQLDAARMTVDGDPARAKEQLAAISEHVQGVVADVRRLVHDLRPPALDDRGLVGALRQQADRLEVPLEVVVEPDGLDGRLPAAVEVAAFRIVGEALTNVARHAGATGARLRLELADHELTVEVADDGVGIDADRQAGVGLVGLRERAAELGGSAEVTCPVAGGTVVRARLPLRTPARSES